MKLCLIGRPKKLAEDWDGPFNETAFLFDAPGPLSGV